MCTIISFLISIKIILIKENVNSVNVKNKKLKNNNNNNKFIEKLLVTVADKLISPVLGTNVLFVKILTFVRNVKKIWNIITLF